MTPPPRASHLRSEFGRSRLDLVIRDARRLSSIRRDIHLEVREKSRRFVLQHPQHGDRHPTNLELRTLTRPQLEHRPPRARVRGHYDLLLLRFRLNGARRLTRRLPALDLVRDPAVT